MSSITIELNTLNNVDLTSTDGRDTVIAAINLMQAAISGTGQRNTDITVSVSKYGDSRFFCPRVFPVLMPTDNIISSLQVPEGSVTQPQLGSGLDNLLGIKQQINSTTAEGTVGQYNYFTTVGCGIQDIEALQPNDTISILGCQFTAVPGPPGPNLAYNQIAAGYGSYALSYAINNHPVLRTRLCVLDSAGAYGEYVIVWIGGPDEKAPASLQYTDYLQSDPDVDHAYALVGWGPLPYQISDAGNAYLGCLINKMPVSSSSSYMDVIVNGLISFRDGTELWSYPQNIVSPEFSQIVKIFL